jgi:superfamily II DNA helicase RecQ
MIVYWQPCPLCGPIFFEKETILNMQIKIYTIPMIGGEAINDEMNVFLRSKRILQEEHQLVVNGQGSFWSFCIKYIEDAAIEERNRLERGKIDYREVLDELSFKRFARMRELRKQLAQEDGIPAYAIFTDEEMAGVAKLSDLTLSKMKSVRGIGDKKVEKYGQRFLTFLNDEKS